MSKIIGIDVQDSVCTVALMKEGKPISLESFSADGYTEKTFKDAKKLAESYLKEPVTQAVLAVSMHLSLALVKKASATAKKSGLEILRTVLYTDAIALARVNLDNVNESFAAAYRNSNSIEFSIISNDDCMISVLSVFGKTGTSVQDADVVQVVNKCITDAGANSGIKKGSNLFAFGNFTQDQLNCMGQVFACNSVKKDYIALGAAVEGAVLSGDNSVNDLLLLNVIPKSFGIEIAGRKMLNFISRNTIIPTICTKTLVLKDISKGQCTLHILYGNSKNEVENESIGILELHDCEDKIEVCFDFQSNLLKVTAKNAVTKNELGAMKFDF